LWLMLLGIGMTISLLLHQSAVTGMIRQAKMLGLADES